jgi:hypothetical protein
MDWLGLGALTFVGYLASGGNARVLGVSLIVIGLLLLTGAVQIQKQTGYTSTVTQIDANTTQETVTYTFASDAPDLIIQILAFAMMFGGLYLMFVGGEAHV